ncbi:hypothetical protein ADICYQ_3278 [Cyclobacterium qasimii M12-11B]|uniref:Uncharacterized protein n=4 Tax=Cyclobacterium qasimii TaxID=1350429 RepID=S7WU59_9BACT|nr:hypothetical protein ADICYQ_3278 [Cyclobacterium qasimii M12-11B]GEO19473.1 hypothetical protein CQA01_00070 [Cyclobacterium qasimii]
MPETVILGTVAIREPGTHLEWDAEKMRFKNAVLVQKVQEGLESIKPNFIDIHP